MGIFLNGRRSFDHNSDALIDRLLLIQVRKETQELAYGNDENPLMSMLGHAAEKDAAWEMEGAKYDISDFSDLFENTPGCTFEPEGSLELVNMLWERALSWPEVANLE